MPTLSLTAVHAAPGPAPIGLTWHGRSLWNADYRTGRLYRLHPDTLDVEDSFVCPGNLSGLAWDGESLWQALHTQGWLRCINPDTHDFDRTLTIDDHGWLGGATWDGRFLWTISQQKGKLFALERERGKIVRTVDVPVAGGGLAYRDGSLWLGIAYPMTFDAARFSFDWTGPEQYAVLQLDGESGEEIARHAVDFLPMGLTWQGDTLWLSDSRAGQLRRAEWA